MKTKVTINGVEYNLDLEKAKELGVLEEKDTRCKSWESFRVKYQNKQGFHYDDVNIRVGITDNPYMINEQLTENEAIAIKAFSKLLKLRRDWIGDWNPDYCNSDERKYCIEVYQNKFYVTTVVNYSKPFSFPTKELAEEFLKCFEELFEQSKCII
jgi:hypothetical protein